MRILNPGLAALLLLLPPAAFSAGPGPSAGEVLRGWAADTGSVLSAPLRWDGRDFGKAGLVAAGAGLSFFWLDDRMEDYVEETRHNELSDLSEKVRFLGDGLFVAGAFGAVYGYGALSGRSGVKEAALVGLESWAISGLIVGAAKISVHRYRPKADAEERRVSEQKLFSATNLSFPSGHSAAAFSSARVAAWYFRESPAAPYVCYSLAGLVAWSRVNDNEHWSSDVFMGSVTGYFVADKVIKLNEGRRGAGTVMLPFYGAGPGVTALYRF